MALKPPLRMTSGPTLAGTDIPAKNPRDDIKPLTETVYGVVKRTYHTLIILVGRGWRAIEPRYWME